MYKTTKGEKYKYGKKENLVEGNTDAYSFLKENLENIANRVKQE